MIFEILLIVLLLAVIFWLFSHLYSSIFYVPYVNSSETAIRDALKLANLKKGDNFLDLGCGRGDGLIIATRDFGANAIGYEISPLPYLLAKIRTRKFRQIKVYRRNIKDATPNIKQADVIYLYLLNSVLDKIENQLFENIKQSAKIVSLAFKFPGHKPTKSAKTTNLGRETNIGLYLKQN